MRNRLAAATALFATLASAIAPAAAADYAVSQRQQTTTYSSGGVPSATLPYCDDARVLRQVEDQFEYGAPRTLNVALQIFEFSGMAERAYQPRTEESPIERRYCQAQALISDQQTRPIYYVIEYPMGFAAAGGWVPVLSRWGWRAEGCVVGLDAWRVYGAECQSLRRSPPSMFVTK